MDSLQIAPKTKENPPTQPIIKSKFKLNKRQKDFITYWVDASSDTFGNAYASAVKAGFAHNTAKMITSNVKNLEWVKEAKEYMDNYSPLHIISGFQYISKHAKADRDKINALDRLAKIRGMYIDRSIQQIDVQFTNDVPRPVIDQPITEVESHNV